MLSLKTTTAALIAALSVIATVSAVPALIPQAFAWIVTSNIGNDDVTASQSNTNTQTSTQSAIGTSGFVVQNSCQSIQEQQAAAGDDASNTASNSVDNC